MFAGEKSCKELTDHELISIINAVGANGTTKITFSGGEATLHPLLPHLIKLSYSKGMAVELLTNGTLVTESFIDEVGRYLERVQVSIDGYSEESNSIHRGKGMFSRALKSVDLLLNAGVPTDIGITPPFSRKLHLEIDKYVDFIENMRIKYKDFPLTLAFTESLMDGRELHLSDEDNAYYSDCIKSISERCFGQYYQVIGFIQFKKILGIDDNCPYGNLNISSTGDIFFCSNIPSMKPMGNIRTHSWSEIYKQVKKAKESSNIANIQPCCNCPIRYICGGQCRIEKIPEFLDCSSLPTNPKRQCTRQDKEKIYQLMIDSNEYIFH